MSRLDDEPWWISLNVTRTRVTLLGFNLSIVAFMSGTLLAIHEEQTFTHHLPAMSAFFVSLAITFLSAGFLLASQELDGDGRSRPWLFSVGDILMYLALSQSLAGVTRKYLGAIGQSLDAIAAVHADTGAGNLTIPLLAGIALAAWCLIIYGGPITSILRSPVRPSSRPLLAAIYLGSLLIVFLVATDAHLVQDVVLDEPEPFWRVLLWQFLQPLTW